MGWIKIWFDKSEILVAADLDIGGESHLLLLLPVSSISLNTNTDLQEVGHQGPKNGCL